MPERPKGPDLGSGGLVPSGVRIPAPALYHQFLHRKLCLRAHERSSRCGGTISYLGVLRTPDTHPGSVRRAFWIPAPALCSHISFSCEANRGSPIPIMHCFFLTGCRAKRRRPLARPKNLASHFIGIAKLTANLRSAIMHHFFFGGVRSRCIRVPHPLASGQRIWPGSARPPA